MGRNRLYFTEEEKRIAKNKSYREWYSENKDIKKIKMSIHYHEKCLLNNELTTKRRMKHETKLVELQRKLNELNE